MQFPKMLLAKTLVAKTLFVAVLAFIGLVLLGSTKLHAQTTPFTASYQGQGVGAESCNTTFSIKGQEPSAQGTFPVFIYTVGTLEDIGANAASDAAISGMASRGFVAATVQYDTADFAGCSVIQGKARCIHDPASANSAVSVLCSRPKADCSKGVVVGGFSQGSVIATLAHDFNHEVRAAWGMGDGVQYAIFDLRSCMKSVSSGGTRTLASDRLRVVNGVDDVFVSLGQDDGRTQAEELTGFNCGSSARSCLQSNGSGWFVVQNSQIPADLDSLDLGGNAEHCYMRSTRAVVPVQCAGLPTFLNDTWQSGSAEWSLGTNLDWLRSFVP
ncbi:MAG TPA: hypothetical protein VKZ53_16705 [Candidatus Angelobacter sp.]|nr:hypothetical protein [Candidatus Angelobacter sp.]